MTNNKFEIHRNCRRSTYLHETSRHAGFNYLIYFNLIVLWEMYPGSKMVHEGTSAALAVQTLLYESDYIVLPTARPSVEA